MKDKSQWISVLLATALVTMAAGAQTQAQTQTAHPSHPPLADLAVTYSTERAKIQSSTCSCFWLNGGSLDGAVTFFHGLGVAGNLTAEHASNIRPGVNLGKFSFVLGPRYTVDASRLFKHHRTRFFAEGLFGAVHGFDSVFPGPYGSSFSSGGFAMQAGVGSDIEIHKGFGIRLFEVDYVHTQLPNNGSNSQNDLRLAFGASYRFAMQ